jgi:environmental stress-induced protein Ves
MILRHADLPASLWPNGAGRKADIATGPGWLCGFAWIDADADFSDYTGRDRTITLLQGDGFVLEFADRPPLVVDRLHVPSWFDGGWPTRCRLLGGPCVVLNANSDRALWQHTVEIREPLPDDTGFAVLLTDSVALPDGSIAGPLDTLPLPVALPPGTICAVMGFTPRA